MLLVMVESHEDMSSFVAVMAGFLIGTSVWAGPKNALCKFFEGTCEWVRKVFFLRLCSWGNLSVSDALLGQEKMYEHFQEECKRFKARIDGWIFALYAVVAVLFGCVAIAELYLGKSAEWAKYNAYLLFPVAAYLFVCLIRSIKLAAVIIWETVKYYGYFSVLHEKGIIGYVACDTQTNKGSLKEDVRSQVQSMKLSQTNAETSTAARPVTESAADKSQTGADAPPNQENKTEKSASAGSRP